MDQLLNEIRNAKEDGGGGDKFILTLGVWTMAQSWKTELAALVGSTSENEKQDLVEQLANFLRSEDMFQRTAAVYVLGLLEHRVVGLVAEIINARKIWQDDVAFVQTNVALEVAHALPKICSGQQLSSVVIPLILDIVQVLTRIKEPTILMPNDEWELAELAKTTTDFKLELVEALTAIMQSGEPWHRANAAYMLGLIGADARTAIPAMIEAMRTGFVNIKDKVKVALLEIGADYALPELARALQALKEEAPSPIRRWQEEFIMDCLAAFGPAASTVAPEVMPFLASFTADKVLISMGFEIMPLLLEYIQSPGSRKIEEYSNAAKVIAGIGPQAVQFLNELLRSDSVENRQALMTVFGKLPNNLNLNLAPAGEMISQVLPDDRQLENIQFKAGTQIRTRCSDGALVEAKLKEAITLGRSKYGAGTQLTFSGNKQGELVKAIICGAHEIQNVSIDAGDQAITLEFVKSPNQLRPSLKTATSVNAPLVANGLPFKPNTPLVFYRPGHLGAGFLHDEVMVDTLWYGPRPQQQYKEEAQDHWAGNGAVRVTMVLPGPAIERHYDIGFYTNGQVAYGTLSRRQRIQDLLLEADCRVFFYSGGQLFGGSLAEKKVIDGIECIGEFRLQENGKLIAGTLADERLFDTIKCTEQFSLYPDGKLHGGTLVGKQQLGPVLCQGHFTLHENGMPNQAYMGSTVPELGHAYKEGWLLRFDPNGNLSGYGQRSQLLEERVVGFYQS